MKEKEIRERIEQFLQRTARNVVVPASVGLSLAGCGQNSPLRTPGDGGADVVQAEEVHRDAAALPDLSHVVTIYSGPFYFDAQPYSDVAVKDDLPAVAPPYLVMMPPDAAPEVASADAESEAGKPSDAGAEVKDAGPDALPDVTSPREVGLDLPAPPPPYLAPPPPVYMIPELAPAGGTAPLPFDPSPKKND